VSRGRAAKETGQCSACGGLVWTVSSRSSYTHPTASTSGDHVAYVVVPFCRGAILRCAIYPNTPVPRTTTIRCSAAKQVPHYFVHSLHLSQTHRPHACDLSRNDGRGFLLSLQQATGYTQNGSQRMQGACCGCQEDDGGHANLRNLLRHGCDY